MKFFAEMEVRLVRRRLLKSKRYWWEEYCLNGGGIDEKHIAEMEAGLMKIYCWNRIEIDKDIAEMEARLMKNIAEMEADWWKDIAECWNGGGIYEKYWWMKVGFSIKLILYFVPNCLWWIVAPNCPTPNCPRRSVCAELSGHPINHYTG